MTKIPSVWQHSAYFQIYSVFSQLQKHLKTHKRGGNVFLFKSYIKDIFQKSFLFIMSSMSNSYNTLRVW